MKIKFWIVLAIAFVFVLGACASQPATEKPAEAKPFRVAVVMPSTINDLAFS